MAIFEEEVESPGKSRRKGSKNKEESDDPGF